MNFFERIKQLADNEGLSLTEVSKRAGLGSRTIYNWNKKSPSINNLISVAKVLNTSIDEILEINFKNINFVNENGERHISQILNIYPTKKDPLSNSLISNPNKAIIKTNENNYQIRIPIIKSRLLGKNLFDRENISDFKDIVFRHKPDGVLLMFRVDSESMLPTVPINSIITVRQQSNIDDKDIVVISANRKVEIRRIKYVNNIPIAIADNIGYDLISLRNPKNIVLGKVVHLDVSF